MPNLPKRADLLPIGIFIGAYSLIIAMIWLGQKYITQCINSAGKTVSPEIVKQCWNEGLAIPGMNEGGPVGAGIVFGIIIGNMNKEQEKRRKFEEGYWKYNPELRKPERNKPEPVKPEPVKPAPK